MIYHLKDMIGSPDCITRINRISTDKYGQSFQDSDGHFVWETVWGRAVPLPFRGGLFSKFHSAWLVLTGKAYSVKWPVNGELESVYTGND